MQKYLVGHKILSVEILSSKTFQGEVRNVIDAVVVAVGRVGKGLIIELNNDYVLAIHLKLTGQIIYQISSASRRIKNQSRFNRDQISKKVGGELPNKFTRVIFKLKAQSLKVFSSEGFDYLYFNDIRKFGWIKVIKKDELENLPFFKEMGPEPPVTNSEFRKALTLEKFKEIVKSSNSPIKIVLMDQKKIGGIGNIYSNEALYLAGVDPKRSAKQISEEKVKKLYEAILEVLKKALKYGGSSDVNFVNALGEDGKYQKHFLVYGRKREKCFNCKGFIEKVQLGGRGTYFCPACQS